MKEFFIKQFHGKKKAENPLNFFYNNKTQERQKKSVKPHAPLFWNEINRKKNEIFDFFFGPPFN